MYSAGGCHAIFSGWRWTSICKRFSREMSGLRAIRKGLLVGTVVLAGVGCGSGAQTPVRVQADEGSTGWVFEEEEPVVSLPDTSAQRHREKGFGVIQLNHAETGLSLTALHEARPVRRGR